MMADVVTGLAQQARQQHGLRRQVTPRVGRDVADHAWHADSIGIAARQQRRARGGADAAIGIEVVERDPFAKQPIDVRRANVLGAKGRAIAPAQIIGQDDDDIRLGRPIGSDCPARRSRVNAATVATTIHMAAIVRER